MKAEKWERRIREESTIYEVYFQYDGSFVFDSILNKLSKEYMIPKEELEEQVKEQIELFLSKHHAKVEYLKLTSHEFKVKIDKKGKNSTEIKRLIKEVTKDAEELIKHLHTVAENLKRDKDVSGWLWKRAVMTEKGFRPKTN